MKEQMSETSQHRNAIVTILTPVHVSTGKQIDPVVYKSQGRVVKRYAMEDILSSLPEKQLLDREKLGRLTRGSNSKKDFYSIFGVGSSFSKEPLYELNWYGRQSIQEEIQSSQGGNPGSRLISEQIKALGKPIIPGSTLKGAIECAFKYKLIKDHFSEVASRLESFCRKKSKLTSPLFYFELVYGIDTRTAEKEYREFLSELYGCLSVSDICFSSMDLLYVRRYPYEDNPKREIPLGYAEYITNGSVTRLPYPIQVNTKKAEYLKKKYHNNSICLDLIERFCSLDNLQMAIQTYTKDLVLEEDLPRGLFLQGKEDVDRATEAQSASNKDLVIRIGKNTSYFYKTVSKLFYDGTQEHHTSHLFDDYFQDVFSPVSRNHKPQPHPEDFPGTFSFPEKYDDPYYGGFIKISYVD